MPAQTGHETNPSEAEPATPLGTSSPSSSNRRPRDVASAETEPDASLGVPGERVVLWLFVILALGVMVAFALFYPSTRPEDREFIVPATLRDLYIPVVAWGILTAIDASRRGRSGWWIYLLASPVPVVNIVLNVQWLRRWRKHPRRVGRFDL